MINQPYKYSKIIRIWLIIGLIMLIGQVVLGGITRLTGSGLSITRWDIVSGVIPPLNDSQWRESFELYKQTPQYLKINKHFTLSDFKFIFYWEYFHRLWVRILGFIFLIPFILFIIRKQINFYLIKRLGLVVLLTALTASAGWIMVKSGLVNRPWVNAYKLTLHFILAVLSISIMVKTVSDVYNYKKERNIRFKNLVFAMVIITFIQMIFAGLMSGMKAGLYYPTWPDMNGHFIPEVLLKSSNWTLINLTNYDSYIFAPALVQFLHRSIAYLLFLLMGYTYIRYRLRVYERTKFWLNASFVLVILQLTLGVLTVMNANPGIPLIYGVLHQLVGILFFMNLLFLYFSIRKV